MLFDGIARLFFQLLLSGITIEILENEELLTAHVLEKPGKLKCSVSNPN
jgi:hypothetical protein